MARKDIEIIGRAKTTRRQKLKRWYLENISWRFGKRPTFTIKDCYILMDGQLKSTNTQLIIDGSTIKPMSRKDIIKAERVEGK